MRKRRPQFTVYFAGPAASLNDLAGNQFLATQIQARSKRAVERSAPLYTVVLAQNLRHPDGADASVIKQQRLRALMHCDLALLQFDGHALDESLDAERQFAAAIDMPTVLFTSDPPSAETRWTQALDRHAGERTQVLKVGAHQEHQEVLRLRRGPVVSLKLTYQRLSDTLVDRLGKALASQPVQTVVSALDNYTRAARAADCGLYELVEHEIEPLIHNKRQRGLVASNSTS